MKPRSINTVVTTETSDFKTAIAAVHTSVNTSEAVSGKDKQGSKASDKELNLMSFAIENFSKYEHKLTREFDENAFIAEYDETAALITQRDEMQGVLNHINAKITAKRVKLKAGYVTIYAASQEATKFNPALKYISDKLGEIYAVASNNDDEAKNKNDTTKAKVTETPAP